MTPINDLTHGQEASVLDAAALARLRELDPTGRAGILGKVLRTYEQSMLRLMAQFDSARATGDRSTLRHVAHTLRSSSASVGALDFSARCTAVEAAVRDEVVDLHATLESMKAESERVLGAVRAMLAERGPAA